MSKETVLTVPRLLIVLSTVATLTFGMFVWDAERALSKLDKINDDNASQNTTLATHDIAIDRLEKTTDNHEQRIGAIEIHNASRP